MIRLLIVDDHAVVRVGLRSLLASQPDFEVVAEAADGEASISIAQQHGPDVILMDLSLGDGIDGVEAIKRMRQVQSSQPIIVFTTYDSDADIVRALDAGAIGYLLKDAEPGELFNAIRSATIGKSTMSAVVASKVFQQMQHPKSALTARESELLILLTQGLTNQELSRKLFVSQATIKTHLSNIYAKLGVDNRAAAISIALQERGIRSR